VATGAICLFVGVGTGVVTLGVAGCWVVRVWVRRLLARADADPLTGLPGRAVAERLLDEVARSGRPVTVALADADQLSTINSVSHADGDRYLIAVARRLCGALAGRGRVVRFGGDEFVLVTALSPVELRSRLEAAPPVPVLIGGLRI
jgi:GGDEF domain-containing protein